MTAVRTPRQARSRATVDAVLAGAARVLVREGFEHVTTNRVAEVAGVSIGTLYQYFPDKDSIFAALAEKHLDAMLTVLQGAFARVAALPPADAARELVAIMFRAHAVDPSLHRALLEQVPVRRLLDRAKVIESFAVTWVKAYLQARRAELRPMDVDLAAFIVAQAVEGLTHAVTLHHPEMLRDERVVEEIARLVVAYLAPRGVDGTARRVSSRGRRAARARR